ncbi:hypothetical protein MNB_SUP05-5-538 [hydrothermal vent metagenome]|uniref:DUF302 domain-containing protein n=1 Tax=hydrothermal vent metagenome TaxID=652676 RepID=A0A1W1C6M1_9ZZZZ
MKYLIIFSLFFSNNLFAKEIIMRNIDNDFSNTWISLQKYIKKQGHQIAFRQRCDFALKQRHFDTQLYRILFFGQYQKIKEIVKRNPKIIPHLPLSITVVESNNKETLLITASLEYLINLVKSEQDKEIIRQWSKDVLQIVDNVKNDF